MVPYRKHKSGIKLAYSELKLDMISYFLSNAETRPSLRLGYKCRLTDKIESCILGEFLKFLEQEVSSSEQAFKTHDRSEQSTLSNKSNFHQTQSFLSDSKS